MGIDWLHAFALKKPLVGVVCGRGRDPTLSGLGVLGHLGRCSRAPGASQNNTDAIVGAVSADRKRLHLADDNGSMQGELRGPDQMEICRSLAEPDRMLAFCRIFERRR
jgi:hypothetical protein